ncbi:unnamed protein product [Eretmochelys imbricata]
MDGSPPPPRSPGLALALVLALVLSGARWAGAGDCKGQRQVLRGPEGFVSDGPGNYSVNGNCEWLIEAPSRRHRVLLTFLFMDTSAPTTTSSSTTATPRAAPCWPA